MVLARNILSYAYNYNYINCIDINDTTFLKSEYSSRFNALINVFGPKMTITPNPAKSWVAMNYQMLDDDDVGYVRITDISGKPVHSFNVYGKQGQEVWDIRWINPGIYIYNFISDRITVSGKIVVY